MRQARLICLVTAYLFSHRSDYIEPAASSSGAKLNDGSWNGVLGMMHRGEAQIADIPLVMTSERESVADFTIPLVKAKYLSLFMTLIKTIKISFSKICVYLLFVVITPVYYGYTVAHLVQELRYKPESCGFDSRWCQSVIDLILTGSTVALGWTQHINRNEYQEYF